MAESGPVYIVKHGKARTVVLSAGAYEALEQRAQIPEDARVAQLRRKFDAMVASMQTPRWRKGIDVLLAASPEELNRIGAQRIRKTRG